MLSNTELNPIVTELFIRGKKLNISFVFISHSYFGVSKNIRINSTRYSIMKIPSKRELQQIAFNISRIMNHEPFMKLYKKCTAKPHSVLVNDFTLASANTSYRIFRKNIKTNYGI